jgi:protein-tyrosine kinase
MLGFLRFSGAKGAVTLLTSPTGSADMRSVIALNLAVCAGAEGARTLLVISDALQHHVGRSAGSERNDRGRRDFADGIRQTPWRGVEFLRLPAPGYQRQAFERLRDLIANRADAYDLIVIDDGLSSTEPVLLGNPSFLDNVIMIVESGHTRRDQLQEGLDALKESRAELTGVVLAA